jgi:predicted N-formylglutamate amidohydrolase
MPQTLLRPDDPSPVTVRRAEGRAPLLIACDHASNRVPTALGNLGLAQSEIERHIGWDIGAATVAAALAERLDAPTILAGYSRLVIDCNRDPDDSTSIPEMSDGTPIPGNRGLSASERAARKRAIFDPYHAEIEGWLKRQAARNVVPALLSVHSFTPVMGGKARPWHVGILWDSDPRIPVPLIEALRRERDLIVGDNEPYSARIPQGYTVRHHAASEGLPHAAIELRQDLVAEDSAAARWAERLAAALAPILARRDIYYVRD